jgi:hypothetical protein
MCPYPLISIYEAKSKLLEAAKLHAHIGDPFNLAPAFAIFQKNH